MRPIDLVAYKELQSYGVNTLPISFSCFLLVELMLAGWHCMQSYFVLAQTQI